MRYTYQVWTLTATTSPRCIQFAVDHDSENSRDDPDSAQGQRRPRSSIVPFLRGETQVYRYNAAFRQIYNDQSDDIAGGDQLNVQYTKQQRMKHHLQSVFDEASHYPTAISKCRIHASRRRIPDSLVSPQQPNHMYQPLATSTLKFRSRQLTVAPSKTQSSLAKGGINNSRT